MFSRSASNRTMPRLPTHRSTFLVAALAALFAAAASVTHASGNEAALRETIAQYEKAWNRHDVNAWASFLTEDVAYTDVYAWGDTGRDAAVEKYSYNVMNQDLKLEIVRMKLHPGDSATVVMRTEFGVLPIKDGSYKAVFKDYPAISRWRVENGQWRMYFFTSFSVRGADIVKKEGLER